MNTTWPDAFVLVAAIYAAAFIIFNVLRALVLKRDLDIARRYLRKAISQTGKYQFTANEVLAELDEMD